MQYTTAVLLIVLSCTRLGAASFLDEQTGSPVERVVKLLVNMKKTLIADEREEQSAYDKYACWCSRMSLAKAKMIIKATAELKVKRGLIDQNQADIVSDYADIDAAVGIIKANRIAQQELTQQRRLENIAFTATRAETSQCIDDMYKALLIVKMAIQAGSASASAAASASASAFLDTKTSHTALSATVMAASKSALTAIKNVPGRSLGSLPAARLAELQEVSSVLAKGTHTPEKYNRKYLAHFNSLVGILETLQTQVKKDFAAVNLAESLAKSSYLSVMDTKVKEQVMKRTLVDKRYAEKGVTESELAKNSANHNNQEKQMKADIAFFENAYKNCVDKSNEMTFRKSERAQELDGVKKAIEVLSGDEARALFIKNDEQDKGSSMRMTISFLQVQEHKFVAKMPNAQKQAFVALKAIATEFQSLKLAKIAARVRLATAPNFFAGPEAKAMRASIDGVTAELVTEQTSDDKKKTACLAEYKDISNKIASYNWDIEKRDAYIGKMKKSIAESTADKSKAIQDISDVDANIAALNKQRQEDQDEFAKLTAQDNEAVRLIKSAKKILMSFSSSRNHSQSQLFEELWGEEDGGQFLEDSRWGEKDEDKVRDASGKILNNEAPTIHLSKSGSRAGQSTGIAGLMTTLVDQYTQDNVTRTADNQKDIAAHALQVTNALTLRVVLDQKRTKKVADATTDGGIRKAQEAGKAASQADVAGQNKYKGVIQTDCDFIIKNWQERHDGRLKEKDGLAKARRIFEGVGAASQAPR